MPRRAYFTPELFKFLRQLKRNNNKPWFEENKDRYIQHVRDPFLKFIADFATPLHEISPHFVADPRPMGGSLFRIYRDVRFARDKSPYKTHAGAQFNHAQSKNVHAPGFYLHLEPGSVFACGGIWRPEAPILGMIRDAIVERPEKWKRAVSGKAFKSLCVMDGEVLSRPPHGYDPNHPLIEDLKRKDILALVPFDEKDACSPHFIDMFTNACRTSAPVMEFLTSAIGLPF